MPLNFTDVAPAKPVPSIVNGSAHRSARGREAGDVGLDRERARARRRAPGRGDADLPRRGVGRHVALIWVAVLEVTFAGVPLNVTDVALARFVPLIVTLTPAIPLAGVKPVIVGGGTTDTTTSRVAALLPPSGSDTLEATWAVLVIVPADVGVTTSVAVALAALASEPRLHRSSWKKPLTTVQAPWLAVEETTVAPPNGIRSRASRPWRHRGRRS